MKNIFNQLQSCLYNEDNERFKELFKSNSYEIDYKDSDGRTIIFYAILSANFEIVEILINNEAELNIKDNNGWYPLHYAVNEYQFDIVELLIKNDANVNAIDDYGNSVLWRAVFSSKGNGEIIQLLLKNGSDPNLNNDSGVSPLSLSKTIANYDVEQFFVNS